MRSKPAYYADNPWPIETPYCQASKQRELCRDSWFDKTVVGSNNQAQRSRQRNKFERVQWRADYSQYQ